MRSADTAFASLLTMCCNTAHGIVRGVVQYFAHAERVMLAPTIREAIDAAVFDITTSGLTRN